MRRPLVILVVLQTALIAWFAWLLWGATPEPAAAGGTERAEEAPEASPLRAAASAGRGEDRGTNGVQRELAQPADLRDTATDRILLFGRILDPQGSPVPEASLSARVPPRRYFRAHVDDRGNYALSGVPPGQWRFYVGASGYRRIDEDLRVDAEPAAQRRDFTLEPAVELKITAFTPEGAPLADAMRDRELGHRVMLSAVATAGPPAGFAPTDNNMLHLGLGRFAPSRWSRESEDAVPGLVGTMELQVDPPVYVSLMLRHVVLASEPVAAGQERMEFRVAVDAVSDCLGSVRVQVVDGETGNPLPGARVSVSDAQSGGGGTPTDEQGTVTIEDVPPGIMDLHVSAKDRAGVSRHFRIAPGEDLDLGTIVLEPALKVSGLVLGPDGKPVQADIRWDDLEHHLPPMPLINNRSTRSNAEGEFSLWNVGPSRFALHVRADELVAHALVDATKGPPEDLEVRLQPGVPVKVVKDIASDRQYLFSIRTRDGLPVYGDLVRSAGDMTLHLPPGEYLADVHEDLTLVRSFAFTAAGAGTRIRVP